MPHWGPKNKFVELRTMGFRFYLNLRSMNKTDIKFELVVKVKVNGDIWILVLNMGLKTCIVGFRTMGFRFQLH